MHTLAIQNVNIVRPHGIENGHIWIEDGIIKGFPTSVDEIHHVDEVIDGQGKIAYPSFFDIHTHGAVNIDVNLATESDLIRLAHYFASQGTGHWLASILTDTKAHTLRQIQVCKAFIEKQRRGEYGGARLEGIHLEGPCLAAKYKGAMPEDLLQKGDPDKLYEYLMAGDGWIRYITVAPEIEGVIDCIDLLHRHGVVVSLGHTDATLDQCEAAYHQGAKAITHCGNVMRLIHQHEPAVLGATLELPFYAELICDGFHLHPGFVRLMIQSKGYQQVMAVSDSMMAAGLPDGDYHLGGYEVSVVGGDAKLKSNGNRAGSTLLMSKALRQLRLFTGLSYEQLQYITSANASRLMRLDHQFGLLERGLRADILLIDDQWMITDHVLGGRRVPLWPE